MQSKNLLLGLLAGLLILGLAGASFFLLDDGSTQSDIVRWDTKDEEETTDEKFDPLTGELLGEADERSELDVPDEPERPAENRAPEARPALALLGRIVNRDGASVTGAKVTLEFSKSGRRGNRGRIRVPKPVVTGRDGTFRFQGKGFRNVDLRLQVTHPDYALAHHRRTVEITEEQPLVDLGNIPIVIGGTVLGSVTDTAGNVAVGAIVRVVPHDRELRQLPNRGRLFPFVKIDVTGTYRLLNLPPGRYRVDATAPNRQYKTVDNIAVADLQETQVEPIQLGPGFELRGTVKSPQGEVVAKADVNLLRAQSRGRANRRRTNAEGKFHYDHLSAGAYTLTVKAKGFLRHVQPNVLIGPNGTPEVAIQLQPGLRIEGVVVDERTGQPVTFYAARVRRVGGLFDPTIEKKRQRLEAIRRDIEQARGPRKQRERRQLERKFRDTVTEIRKSGLALDGRGRMRGDGGGKGRQKPRRPEKAYAGDPGKPGDHENGAFSFKGLEEGYYVVDFGSPVHQRLRSERIELRRGLVPTPLHVTLPRGLVLEGKVLSSNGEPLPKSRVDLLLVDETKSQAPQRGWGAVVAQFRGREPRGRPVLRARTDGNGRFEIAQAGPGTYAIAAHAEGHARGFTEVFQLSRDRRGLQLELGKLGRIEGKVRGVPRKKLDEARVLVTDFRRREIVKVRPDGTYAVENLHPGKYLVRAFAGSVDSFQRASARMLLQQGGNAPQQIHVDVILKDGQSARFDVAFTNDAVGTVSGRVMVNGRGARNYSIALKPVPYPGMPPKLRQMNRFWGTTDQKGDYEIKEVPVGKYSLLIRAAGRGGRELHKSRFFVQAETNNRQTPLILSIAQLQGVVRTKDNANPKTLRGNVRLLFGVSQAPTDMKAFRERSPIYQTRINRGRFEFKNLPAGQYFMTMRIGGRRTVEQSLYVGAYEAGEQTFDAGDKVERKKKQPKGKPRPKGKTPQKRPRRAG